MNKKLLLPAAIIFCSSLLSAGFLFNPPKANSDQHVNILMREIGHQVLHAAGDSTSRVMPVQKISENIFQISFEAPLTFEPDTLVKIVSDIMKRDGFKLPYVVNVIDCTSNEVIYGYEIGEEKQDIVPCLGRKQPHGCYLLQIGLLEYEQAGGGMLPSLGILAGGTLLVLGLIFFKPQTKKTKSASEEEHFVSIGSYVFHPEKGLLRHEGNMVELTVKESRVLATLSREINATVLREKLNEIWADEGVITGRSLDVFVSKLRKRFVNDPAIRIINVHGKGYRLEVVSDRVSDPHLATN
jgi:DNA-binding winged helix-turn-helix (wHTH) protein